MMKKLLFFIAVAGWAASLTVHILSILDVDVREEIPFIFILHIGIFIVWIPVILELRKNPEYIEFRQNRTITNVNPAGFYKIVFKGIPLWITVIVIGGFVYAILNFTLLIDETGGIAEIKDGQYILQNHGKLIKTLNKKEYIHYRSNELRTFSGHWIAFYGMSAAMLFRSVFKAKAALQP